MTETICSMCGHPRAEHLRGLTVVQCPLPAKNPIEPMNMPPLSADNPEHIKWLIEIVHLRLPGSALSLLLELIKQRDALRANLDASKR